jgi:hypothetical protein
MLIALLSQLQLHFFHNIKYHDLNAYVVAMKIKILHCYLRLNAYVVAIKIKILQCYLRFPL